MLKRALDIAVSFVGLVCLSPLLLLLALLIKVSSEGPVFYTQTRVKKNKQLFGCYKFRTMRMEHDAAKNDGITGSTKMHRITKIGHVLRNYRLDELPQLINVLRGDMSLVGPRPQIPKYIDIYPEAYDRILQVQPGITGLASIKMHRYEERMLMGAEHPEEVYIQTVLPKKFRYEFFYITHQSFCFDMSIIVWTARHFLRKR